MYGYMIYMLDLHVGFTSLCCVIFHHQHAPYRSFIEKKPVGMNT